MRYWIYRGKGKTEGLFDVTQLAALAANGQLNADTPICPEGSEAWSPAETLLPALFAASAARPSEPAPKPGADTASATPTYEAPTADDQSALLFLPARLVASLIDWLAGLARGGLFESASRHAWQVGQFAFLGGAAALMLFWIIVAVRIDSLSMTGYALLVPIAAAVGQFASLRFVPTNETLVRNSPLRASSETFFQLLGFVLILSAAILATLGIYAGIKEGDMLNLAFVIAFAIVLATIGFLFFSPTSLSLTIDPAARAGEDGLALIGTLIKSLLASSRFIFGMLSIGGGVMAVVGAIWFLFDRADPRSEGIALAGGTTLLIAAFYPLYAYLLAILYFVLVDALKGMISLSVKSDPAKT
jgi:hypothetical protein